MDAPIQLGTCSGVEQESSHLGKREAELSDLSESDKRIKEREKRS